MLKAGNIRLEMHESTIQAGAQHEPVGTHLHNEIWLVREGTAELTTNGVAKTMVAGDVGICVAGDKHFISNTSDKPVTYFVVTVGPPE
jgi:quercetin dioxygenase-like cupin family protein